MKTEQTVFNIIWLDDEIDSLYRKHKGELLDEGINVLGKGAQNVEEFEFQIQKFRNVVDAVVTDANFNLKDRNDCDGLIDVSYLIKKYNNERPIPFIVFTGRDNLRHIVHEKTIRQFDEIVSKQDERGIETLIAKVKAIVLKVNSKEFRIHNKYCKELEAASLVPGNEEFLMNALLYDYSEDWKNTEDYFNPMRTIVESIFSACKRDGIIPDVGELNQISRFLNGEEHDVYVWLQEIMPKPLVRGLWYFLNITQDGSHKKNDLHLKVREYVRETQNINLFRSVLYIAMDICLWYAKCKEEMQQPDYRRKWERKRASVNVDNTKEAELTQEKYEYEGVVKQEREKGIYYCGRFLLQLPRDGSIQEEDTIGIIESQENTQEHILNEDGNKIDRFVNYSKMIKLK